MIKATVPIHQHLIASAMDPDSLDASSASSRRGSLRRRHLQEFCGECIFREGESCEERAQFLVRWSSGNFDTAWTLERAKSSVLNDWADCTYKEPSSGISNGAIVGIVFGIMTVLLCVLGLFAKRRFDSRDEVKDVIRETAPSGSSDAPLVAVEGAPAPIIKPRRTNSERIRARKPGKRISFAMDNEPDPSSGDKSKTFSEADCITTEAVREEANVAVAWVLPPETGESPDHTADIPKDSVDAKEPSQHIPPPENDNLDENTEAEINPNENGCDSKEPSNSDAAKYDTAGTPSEMHSPQEMEESKCIDLDKVNGEPTIESVELTSDNPEKEKLDENSSCESKKPSNSDAVENSTGGTPSDMHCPQEMEESKYVKLDKVNGETTIESVELTSVNPEKEKLDENTCESKKPSNSDAVENGTGGTASDMHCPQEMEESKYVKLDKLNGETTIESVGPTSDNPEKEKLDENSSCESKEPSNSDAVENGTGGTASDMHCPQEMEESKYDKTVKINGETTIESVEPTSDTQVTTEDGFTTCERVGECDYFDKEKASTCNES